MVIRNREYYIFIPPFLALFQITLFSSHRKELSDNPASINRVVAAGDREAIILLVCTHPCQQLYFLSLHCR